MKTRDEKTNKMEPEEYNQILVSERNKSQQLILGIRGQKKKKRERKPK